ncbi:DegT/DnrJ/EryC1/StrS family aminotransferase [Lacinutrix chionoecetis]
MNSKIWLSPPHIGNKEIAYVNKAFKSNWMTTSGENVDHFETLIESYLEDKVSVTALNSGTSAIHLALIKLGVKPNDEVLCQSLTFCGSANPIAYLGANPVFIDSEKETLNMCPEFLEKAILEGIKKNKKPKAIIVVHLYGMPAKIDAIKNLSLHYNIPLIEDAAEALGSTYKSEKCGTFGDYAIFSFNGNKIITTTGGGALISKSQKEKDEIIHLASQAKEDALHYQHTKIGYNYRMSNVLAGIGCAQIKLLETRLKQLKKNYNFYDALFEKSKNFTLFKAPGIDFSSNYWLNIVFINEQVNFTVTDVIVHLQTLNIEAKPLWKPMHLQPVFKNAKYFGGSVSENLFNAGLCLPSGSNLSKDDKNRISSALNEFI